MTKPSLVTRVGVLSQVIEFGAEFVHYSERFIGPFADLLTRWWLAQAFFVSGILKLADWNTALYLAANEYPVSWLDPVAAAWLGAGTEVIGALMLALGLGTRLAALPMLVLSAVTQANYVPRDATLLMAALLAGYVVRGAGPLALDRAISAGFEDSPLPFATMGMRGARWLTQHLFPLYQLVLRAWLALALSAVAVGLSLPISLALWVPFASVPHLPSVVAPIGAMLLASGTCTRPMSGILILGLIAHQMLDFDLSVESYWLLLFAFLAFNGAGQLSVDGLLQRILRRRYPQLEGKPAFALEGLPRVVIVGAGFGGLTCAARLRRAPVAVTLIDRHNYHLFQPLLYQVATAALSPGDIATPIRGLFRDQFNTRVLFAEVTGIDTAKQEVIMAAQRISYDYLVLATGASHSYFGKDEWGIYAPGLKRVEDATEIRRRLLTAFELAETADDALERQQLLTFVIVGAGPTGVELAGAVAELAHFGMTQEFRRIDPRTARILLVQSGPRVLPSFPEKLSIRAQRALEKLGVEVLVNSRVERIDDAGVTVSGRPITARTILWAAGVIASPAATWLNVAADNAGRVKVNADLSVPGLPAVYVIGDTAASNAWHGQAVPGLAPAAKQAGNYVAQVLKARVFGKPAPAVFTYHHLGSLATIGRKAAVADFGAVQLAGAAAWWLWGLIHVGFLVGLRSRISVMLDWFWSYLTFRSSTRLITGKALIQRAR